MNEPNGETVNVNGLISDILAPEAPAPNAPAEVTPAAAPAAPAQPQGEVTPPEKTFTQDEVNSMLKAERVRQEDRVGKLKNAGLSEEQIKILEDQDLITRTREELASLDKQKVENLFDQHAELISKLDAGQVEQLRSGSPQKVGEFLTSLSSIVAKATPGAAAPQQPAGELVPMNSAIPSATDSSPEMVEYSNNIEKGLKSGNWGGVVDHLFGQYSK